MSQATPNGPKSLLRPVLLGGVLVVAGFALGLIALPVAWRGAWFGLLGLVAIALGVTAIRSGLPARERPNVGFGIIPRLQLFDARVRSAIAFILVFGSLGVIAFGLYQRTDPAELVQYVSPISGLAGIAVGYYFGRASDGSGK